MSKGRTHVTHLFAVYSKQRSCARVGGGFEPTGTNMHTVFVRSTLCDGTKVW